MPSFAHASKRRRELSSDAWDTRRRRAKSCGSVPANCLISWNLPVEQAIRIGSGTRRSASRRIAARSQHTLPNRRSRATAARHDGKGLASPKHSELTRRQHHTSRGSPMAQLLQNKVRALVSKKKHRMREDGFDLDLTYVTPRIIAMGIPSVDYQKVYRNRIEDVERFLETRHSTNYKVYNLCSEMRNTYAMTRFGGRFERFPFDDHSPPPLGLLYYFCESAHRWLSQSKENVIAVHCKAGKGRTGTCISAYFLYARLYRTPSEAMGAYGSARTKNRKGVTIPSQRRFVEYFGHCCERRHVVDLDSVYTTHRFRDEDLGGRGWGAPCEQLLDQAWNARWRQQATDCPAPPRRALILKGVRSTVGFLDVYCGGCIYNNLGGRLAKPVPLTEEVHVSIKGKKKGYGFWFHCSFVEGSILRITKLQMDKAWKDKAFPDDAVIELVFETIR